MKFTFSSLLLATIVLFGCDLFIEEYVAPECEGGSLYELTGVCWQDPMADGGFNISQALDYCDSLTLADHNDWRLPTIFEYFEILGDCDSYEIGTNEVSCNSCENSSYCTGMFGPSEYLLWSSSSVEYGYCIIDLGGGSMNYVDDFQVGQVRCVRP